MTKEKLREVLIAYTVNLYEKYTPSPLLDMGIVAKDVDDYLSTLPAETEDVFTETGLTPRQLAEQRAELLEACLELKNAPHYEHFAVRFNDEENAAWEKIKAAISNATKHLTK